MKGMSWGQVEQVGTFGLVELQRRSERFEHLIGGTGEIPALAGGGHDAGPCVDGTTRPPVHGGSGITCERGRSQDRA